MQRIAFMAETWQDTAAAFRELLEENEGELAVSKQSPMTAYFIDGVEIRAVALSGKCTHSLKSWWFDQIVLVNPESGQWWRKEPMFSAITHSLRGSPIPPEWQVLAYYF
jgi:hypothetical protein